jgi:hypothetical protein
MSGQRGYSGWIPSRYTVAASLAAMTFMVGACSTDVYKTDVGTFKTAVVGAATSFTKARESFREQAQKTLDKSLAAERPRIRFAGACGEIISSQLVKDTACMDEWATYRATPKEQRGSAPRCVEPKGYYRLPIAKERDACAFGAEAGTKINPRKVTASEYLQNTAGILESLAAYADALTQISDSKDSEELKSAVGNAKTALETLADRLKGKSGGEFPGKEVAGPVADLGGALLVAYFNYRRYTAMRQIVGDADPVVSEAAQFLSRAAMVLMIPRLFAAGGPLESKTNRVNTTRNGEEYLKRLQDLRDSQSQYLAVYETHLTDVFVKMGEAHASLAKALRDPSTQYDSMKKAIQDFGDKAKAAQAAIEKFQEDSKKSSAKK